MSIIFITTKLCHDKHVFAMTNVCLLQQNTSFVATKICLMGGKIFCNKIMFVATNTLSRQIFATTNTVCRDKSFVMISIFFS